MAAPEKPPRKPAADSFDCYVFLDAENNVKGVTRKKDLVLDFIETNPNTRHIKSKIYNNNKFK